jgi:hypothetical protein
LVFLLSHTTMHRSINIKVFIIVSLFRNYSSIWPIVWDLQIFSKRGRQRQNAGGHLVWGAGPQPFDLWDRGFESCWEHGCPYLVLVVCCAGIGLYYVLTTQWDKSYFVCVYVRASNFIWSRNLKNEEAYSQFGQLGHRKIKANNRYCSLIWNLACLWRYKFSLLFRHWLLVGCE